MKDNEHTPAAPANVGDRGDNTLRREVERLSPIAATAGAAALRNFTGTRAGEPMWNWNVEKAAEIAAPHIVRALLAALAVAVPVPDEEGQETPEEALLRDIFMDPAHRPAPAAPGSDTEGTSL